MYNNKNKPHYIVGSDSRKLKTGHKKISKGFNMSKMFYLKLTAF